MKRKSFGEMVDAMPAPLRRRGREVQKRIDLERKIFGGLSEKQIAEVEAKRNELDPDELRKRRGQLIKQFRENRGLTRQEFAALIGASDQGVRDLEEGSADPDIRVTHLGKFDHELPISFFTIEWLAAADLVLPDYWLPASLVSSR